MDFIIYLYKCELTYFHDGGVAEYISTIKDIIRDELMLDKYYDELEDIFTTKDL